MLDFLTVCNLGILMNVLDFDTYTARGQTDDVPPTDEQQRLLSTYDFNAVTHVNRRGSVLGRAQALDLIQWFFWNYDLYEQNGDVQRTLGNPEWLAQGYFNFQCAALFHYKSDAEAWGWAGARNSSADEVRHQLCNIFREVHMFHQDGSFYREQKVYLCMPDIWDMTEYSSSDDEGTERRVVMTNLSPRRKSDCPPYKGKSFF